eukprot:scaffold305_cov247-Pinguiococcus_pyrenoidosus.AAC.14
MISVSAPPSTQTPLWPHGWLRAPQCRERRVFLAESPVRDREIFSLTTVYKILWSENLKGDVGRKWIKCSIAAEDHKGALRPTSAAKLILLARTLFVEAYDRDFLGAQGTKRSMNAANPANGPSAGPTRMSAARNEAIADARARKEELVPLCNRKLEMTAN